MLPPIGELISFHRSGDARLIAVTAPQHVQRLPEVSTFAEIWFAALTFGEWYVAILPARASEEPSRP